MTVEDREEGKMEAEVCCPHPHPYANAMPLGGSCDESLLPHCHSKSSLQGIATSLDVGPALPERKDSIKA